MARRRFSEREVIETLIYQGVEIPCFRCREPFGLDPMNEMPTRYFGLAEREHLHEIALGGPDEPVNCRYSCHFCHGEVTNGSKATSAGSSKQRIAKVKRLIAGPKKPKGRKLEGRGFDKRSRPMNQRYEPRVRDVNE